MQTKIRKGKVLTAIYTAQPSMPDLGEYTAVLKEIWKTKWLTNNGVYHRRLEVALTKFLDVRYCSLFCNGTLALMIAIKALGLEGDVITTPFTFPATINVLNWLNIRPVFCDIDANTYNLDPSKIEPLITKDTTAIMPVHVYGRPCDVEAIQKLAQRHKIRVIYDAAHAFGVRIRNKPLVDFGDVSMVSFHATKLYTTLEGGALFLRDSNLKREVDRLKNFGILDEETVVSPGINAKMNELQAAFGLLHLKMVNEEIRMRKRIADLYRSELVDIPGFVMSHDMPDVKHNYAYFPVTIEKEKFGVSRDDLCSLLKDHRVNTRKYFYPLASNYGYMIDIPTRGRLHLPIADRVSKEILCLPIYGNLRLEIVKEICALIRTIHEQSVRKERKRRSRES